MFWKSFLSARTCVYLTSMSWCRDCSSCVCAHCWSMWPTSLLCVGLNGGRQWNVAYVLFLVTLAAAAVYLQLCMDFCPTHLCIHTIDAGVCVYTLVFVSADAQVSQWPTSGQRPLASNCKWIEPLWESEPIHCPGNLSINGQLLAVVCQGLTLSSHFMLVLISHSRCRYYYMENSPGQSVQTKHTINCLLCYSHLSNCSVCVLGKVTGVRSDTANMHFKMLQKVFIFYPRSKST